MIHINIIIPLGQLTCKLPASQDGSHHGDSGGVGGVIRHIDNDGIRCDDTTAEEEELWASFEVCLGLFGEDYYPEAE